MDKFYESLIILQHFNDKIKSRNEFCKRFSNFDVHNCIGEAMNHFIMNGYVEDVKILSQEPYISIIATQCSDIRITIHNNFCMNIIDMFSFNEEYEKFFSENSTENENLKERITKVKKINKNSRSKINWDELKLYRNTILAHNLRNKKDDNNLAINNLIKLHKLIYNFDESIKYCEIIEILYNNIISEFSLENAKANIEFEKLIHNNK